MKQARSQLNLSNVVGRIEYLHRNIIQAVNYLREGLHIDEQLSRGEDEARIRHRLGLTL